MTAFTSKTNEVLAVRLPSFTVIVMVDDPDKFVAARIVTVRFEPEPPKTMFERGTSVGFDEAADRVKFVAAVSASPIIKLIGAVEVSSFTDRIPILEMVGGALTWILALAELASPNVSVAVKLTV